MIESQWNTKPETIKCKTNLLEYVLPRIRQQEKHFQNLVNLQESEFVNESPNLNRISLLQDKIDYTQDTLDALRTTLLQCRI